MARRRRRSSGPLVLVILVIAAVGAFAYLKLQLGKSSESAPQRASLPASASGTPLVARFGPSTTEDRDTDELGTPARPLASLPPAGPQEPSDDAMQSGEAASLLHTGLAALSRDDLLEARTRLNAALAAGPAPQDAATARSELAKLADETIFSGRILPDDPLTFAYTIEAGDTLVKIAAENRVTADVLARINGIRDKNVIRLGQRIKVLRGPFHAVISKTALKLDLYLQDTFVKQIDVGLGAEGSTPTGEWVCENKLVNPTYYPPRGGRIIAADDPENPLGERWIGLKGVKGEASGQERYGIHGTIEPDSIGKNVSMGCVRLRNDDVAELYDLLIEDESQVIVHQ